jgi:hypothetical protein
LSSIYPVGIESREVVMAEKTGGSKGQQPEALKTFGAASRAGSVKPEDQGLTATSETRPKPKDSAQKNEAAAEVLNAGATGKPKTSAKASRASDR